MPERDISIVIPTWNGKDILAQFLPSVFCACEQYAGRTEVVIIDDGSTDGTLDFLKENFKQARIVHLDKNHGYGYACNEGVSRAQYDLIVLLNNDVEVRKDFLAYLAPYFEDSAVFAVRIRVFPYEQMNEIESGALKPKTVWIRGEFKLGFISYPAKKTCLVSETPHGAFAFSVGAGAFAIDKQKWLALGGFDNLYQPFYAEETDIAYRALKRGWKIPYEPRSIVYHKGEGFTITKAKPSWYIRLIGERNRYFLVWKNLTGIEYTVLHIIFVPFRLLKNIFTIDLASFAAFFYGLLWLPLVLRRRAKERRSAKVSDKEIFSYFSLQ